MTINENYPWNWVVIHILLDGQVMEHLYKR